MTHLPPATSGIGDNQRPAPLLAVRRLKKRFGTLHALDDVTLEFAAGEIHAVLGENGAGKSTLMHVLSGIHRPDAGAVLLDGEPARFRSAGAARQAGIGMVHQHFALVDALTVAENLALSLPGQTGWRYREGAVAAEARELAIRAGLQLAAPDRVVGSLPVGDRQRLEILKALAGGGRALILDEPTAVLTPQEVDSLFAMLRALREQGRAIIFITHKLREALALADRISILRRGRLVTTVKADGVTEHDLARHMVGERPPAPAPAASEESASQAESPVMLSVAHLNVRASEGGTPLDDITFDVAAGEILGIAGVDGNGQRELFNVLVGMQAWSDGRVTLGGTPLGRLSPDTALAAGISHIPPDRHHEGLILDMSVGENFILSRVLLDRFASYGSIDRAAARTFAMEEIRRFDIRVPGLDSAARTLSGGNQQRIVVARQLAPRPRVLITVNPTRGLDIRAADAVAGALRAAAAQGCAIVLISTDLDEVLELSRRIAVLYAGRLSVPMSRPFDLGKLGLRMAGAGA